MGKATKHTINYSFKTKIETVYNTVLDFREFGKHHPYITGVEILEQTPAYINYHITEKILLFGFIPQRPEYDAKVFELEKGKHIQYTSLIKGKVGLKIDFTFKEENGFVYLTEVINLKGNWLICKILLGAMKKAHVILFSKI